MECYPGNKVKGSHSGHGSNSNEPHFFSTFDYVYPGVILKYCFNVETFKQFKMRQYRTNYAKKKVHLVSQNGALII